MHIHVGNCVLDPALPGYGDMHPRFGWPGGMNDVPELAEFIRGLFQVGYLAEVAASARGWALKSNPRAPVTPQPWSLPTQNASGRKRGQGRESQANHQVTKAQRDTKFLYKTFVILRVLVA